MEERKNERIKKEFEGKKDERLNKWEEGKTKIINKYLFSFFFFLSFFFLLSRSVALLREPDSGHAILDSVIKRID